MKNHNRIQIVVKPSKRKRLARLKGALQRAPLEAALALKGMMRELEVQCGGRVA